MSAAKHSINQPFNRLVWWSLSAHLGRSIGAPGVRQTTCWETNSLTFPKKGSKNPSQNQGLPCCNQIPNLSQNPQQNGRTHGRHSVSKWLSCYSASEQRLKFGLSEVPPGACPLKSGLWRVGDVWETGRIKNCCKKYMYVLYCMYMCNLYHEIMLWVNHFGITCKIACDVSIQHHL